MGFSQFIQTASSFIHTGTEATSSFVHAGTEVASLFVQRDGQFICSKRWPMTVCTEGRQRMEGSGDKRNCWVGVSMLCLGLKLDSACGVSDFLSIFFPFFFFLHTEVEQR